MAGENPPTTTPWSRTPLIINRNPAVTRLTDEQEAAIQQVINDHIDEFDAALATCEIPITMNQVLSPDWYRIVTNGDALTTLNRSLQAQVPVPPKES